MMLRSVEAIAGVPGLLRRAHDLTDKALGLLAAGAAIANAPRPDAEVVVAIAHAVRPR